MTQDTVTISTSEYNKLRDFFTKIRDGKICIVRTNRGTYYSDAHPALEEISLEIEKLKKELSLYKQKDELISDLKQMTIRQFLKWRKTK